MSNTTAIAIPTQLTFSELKFYVLATAFTAGNIALPLLVHQVGGQLAGQMLLPIYFFSLISGLTYGWRLGFTVGILSPLISFGLSGMPPIMILPFVVLKSAILGLTAGVVSRRFRKQNLVLIAAIAVSLTQIIGITAILLISHKLPLALADIKLGYLGLLLQILLAPRLANIMTHEYKTS